MHFTATTFFLATFATWASAYSATARTFAVNHFYGDGPLVMGRMDPIVNPGVPSGHVHAVQGGNNFALTMTDAQALDSTCTSSLVKNDKSNYWVPSLYFHAANGSFISVPMFYMNVYYFFEPTTDEIKAFQPGHRMVIGNPHLRSPPATGGRSILDLNDGTPQPVQWTCPRSNTNQPLYPVNSDGLHGVGIQDPGNAGAGVGFPDQNCDGYASPLRADIHFASCYNPAFEISDYENNMAFPTKGNCPEGWVHTPHLFYEVYWNTPLFADEWTPGQGNQPFVLSNGDPTGYGLHADFLSGWDPETLQQIIDNCNAGDAGMDKCPGLIGGLNNPSDSCNIVCPVQEPILGALDALPGNNPLGQWGVDGGSSPPTSAPIASPTPKASVPPVQSSKSETTKASPAKTETGGGGQYQPTPTVSKSATSTESSTSKVVPTRGSGGSHTLTTSYRSETTMIRTTVSATGPAPTSTSGSSSIDGWTYTGCYSDSLGDGNRVMTGIELANVGQHAVTNTKCVAYCNQRGYSMAGTEYGGQCFCANTLAKGSSKLDDSKCNMPCEGDSSETCGGSLALSVYSSKARRMRNRHLHQHLHGVSSS